MRLPLWAAVILLLAPPAAGQTTLQEQTREKSIRVSEVPQPARDAAQRPEQMGELHLNTTAEQ